MSSLAGASSSGGEGAIRDKGIVRTIRNHWLKNILQMLKVYLLLQVLLPVEGKVL